MGGGHYDGVTDPKARRGVMTLGAIMGAANSKNYGNPMDIAAQRILPVQHASANQGKTATAALR